MADAAENFLARNLGRIRRTPELREETHLVEIGEIEVVEDMILEMALARVEAIEHFTPNELDFFARGDEEERIYLTSLDGID